MNRPAKIFLATLMGGLMFAGNAAADAYFEVTVTNITKGMVFTPIMVASTKPGDGFFETGSAASPELEAMAEMGALAGLQASLDAYDVTNSSFLPFLAPGESVTQTVATTGQYKGISIAAMLVPSNDTFFAVNSIAGPKGNKTMTVYSVGYDAGTEMNDELCASLPGPGCGPDAGPPSMGEGYVYVSNGIQGVGDLDAALRDFNNPVAKITITRVEADD